jgi:TPR repeat protein
MLHGGLGVPKDQRKAFEFYQMAGELGSKDGWKNVVACYTTGEGVAKSAQSAQYIVETMLKED